MEYIPGTVISAVVGLDEDICPKVVANEDGLTVGTEFCAEHNNWKL